MKWYIIHTTAGSENLVKKNILERAQKAGVLEFFDEIKVPAVEITGLRKGKSIQMEKKLLPSYVFIKMELNDSTWHLVRTTNKVTGFLGSGSKPTPVSEKEINDIFTKLDKEAQNLNTSTTFEIGETVKIVEGPFSTFNGVIEEIDSEKGSMKVQVVILGRSTPIVLNQSQVERILK